MTDETKTSLATTRTSSGLSRRHQQARLKRVALQFLSNIYMHSETVQDQMGFINNNIDCQVPFLL